MNNYFSQHVRRSEQRLKYSPDYGFGMLHALPYEFKVLKKIGQGANGSVFLLCKDEAQGCVENYVLKIVQRPHRTTESNFLKEFSHEVKMHRKLAILDLAPELITAYVYKRNRRSQYGVIVMERVNILNQDLNEFTGDRVDEYCTEIVKGVDQMISKLCTHGITHGDLHNENIGFIAQNADFPYKFMPIDFGTTTDDGCSPAMDILQLIRSIMMDEREFKNRQLWKCLITNLFELYQKYEDKDIKIRLDFDDIEDRYDDLVTEHSMRTNLQMNSLSDEELFRF